MNIRTVARWHIDRSSNIANNINYKWDICRISARVGLNSSVGLLRLQTLTQYITGRSRGCSSRMSHSCGTASSCSSRNCLLHNGSTDWPICQLGLSGKALTHLEVTSSSVRYVFFLLWLQFYLLITTKSFPIALKEAGRGKRWCHLHVFFFFFFLMMPKTVTICLSVTCWSGLRARSCKSSLWRLKSKGFNLNKLLLLKLKWLSRKSMKLPYCEQLT